MDASACAADLEAADSKQGPPCQLIYLRIQRIVCHSEVNLSVLSFAIRLDSVVLDPVFLVENLTKCRKLVSTVANF